MSYAKAMRCGRKHPKDTRQPVLMHTDSGFWPAHSWVVEDWEPYVQLCKERGVQPMECKAFYDAGCKGRIMAQMNTGQQVEHTRTIQEHTR